MLTGTRNANNMQRDKKLIKCLTQITCTHKYSHTHRRRIQIPSPTDKGDFIHRCKRQRQRQVTDTNFPKSREFVLPANTMCQQQQYQHHHIKTITFPLYPILWRAFLSWTKFGCLLVQAFLFLAVVEKRWNDSCFGKWEWNSWCIYASTEPKLDKFISTAECQRKMVEKEIEWYDDGVRIKRKSVFQETNFTTIYRIHTHTAVAKGRKRWNGKYGHVHRVFTLWARVCVFSSRNCCCYFCECSFVFPLRTHHHTLPLCYNHCMCSVLCMFKIHKS